MPQELAAGYCAETWVEAFLLRVGTENRPSEVKVGRRQLWLSKRLTGPSARHRLSVPWRTSARGIDRGTAALAVGGLISAALPHASDAAGGVDTPIREDLAVRFACGSNGCPKTSAP